MAEVKRATPALSSLSSKKPPSYTTNAGFNTSSSSSSKHIYDNVFASPTQRNLKTSRVCSFLDDDYGEIFGSSKSDDGSRLAPCSSVPILELSPESRSGRRPARGGEREIDYCGVFRGFGDDSLGVEDGKELFDQLKKKAKTSSSSPVHMQRSEGQTPEVPISHISKQSDSGRAQSNGFRQSFDKVEHFKHKNSGITTEGATCTTRVHDTPGSTCKLDEGISSQKSQSGKSPVIKDDTELGTDINLKKKQEIYSRNRTLGLAADKQNSVHDACSQKASGFSVSNPVAEFHDTDHQSAINLPSKIVDDDAKVGFDVKGDASLAGVSDLSVNRKNSEHDASLHAASVVTSHETSQVAGCSNMVDVEANLAKIAAASNVGKKKWRHSRMTSLDFGDHKEAHETGFHRKSRLGTSYSFDASHDPISAHIRVQSSKAVPSSSVPQFFPVESHCKILENSRESSANNAHSFEEHLDVGSAAAVSVVALQRALQEAEMKMRLAKQFLEREGQGSTKWSFKDTLKAKVAKENKHANDLDEYRPLSFKGALKEKVVKDNKCGNDVNEFQLQKIREDCVEIRSTLQSSHSERRNVNGSAHFTPVLDGQKKSSEDEDPKVGEGSKMSKLIEEGDKHEGEGEWEAAKPLNQLISGVKNKIASFMTWRADAEKKVESQEVEAANKSPQAYGEIQTDLKDLGISEMEEAENNKCSSTSASNSDHEENEIGLIQMASEPKEEELTRCSTLKEDKASGNIDLIRDFKGSSGESFLHFTFMGERSHNLSAHEGEKQEAQENTEPAFEKIQEPLLKEAKDEQLQGKYEESKTEVLDGSFMSQDCGNCNEESDGTAEVDYSKAKHEIKESIHQEESYRRLNEQHGEEQTDKSDRPEDVIERNKTDVQLDEYEVQEEAEDLQGEVPLGNSSYPGNVTEVIENDNVLEEESLKEAEVQQDNILPVKETKQVREIEDEAEVLREMYEWRESDRVERDEGMSNPVENVTAEMPKWGEDKSQSQTFHTAEVVEHSSFITADADCRQTKKVFLGTDEEVCQISWGNPGMEEAVLPDEESDRILEIRSSSSEPKTDMQSPILHDQESERMMEIPNPSSELKMDFKNPILTQKGSESIGQERVCTPVSTENNVQCEGIKCQDGTNGSFPYETPVLEIHETDANCVQKDIGGELMESEPEDILKHHTDDLHAYEKTFKVEEVASVSDQGDKCSVEAGHRRRRWFENGDQVGSTDRPSILEARTVNFETDQEASEEPDLAGSVEIDSLEVDDTTKKNSIAREADTPLNKEDHKVNVQAPQKRRRWFVNKGEGVPEPPNLFESTTVTSDVDPQNVNESIPNDMSDNCVDKLPTESGDCQTVPEADVVINELKDKYSNEAAPRRKRWFENGERVIPAEPLNIDQEAVTTVEINQGSNTSGDKQKCDNLSNTPIPEEKDGTERVEPVNELQMDSDAVKRKEKERAKERIAVERVIREARERAFTEARERARRDAVERPNTEPRQRAGGMAQDRTGSGKASAEATSSSDRASMEAKLKAERAAVERATAEARERAMQKALSDKASHKSKEQAGRPVEKNSSMDPRFHSSSSYSRSSQSSNKAENFDGAEAESPQRHKARLERQNRTMERAAKALEEKNKRDVLAQKEQAARNVLADSLDAEVKRWSCGKEGNLRALLSTLQDILGPESGWQAVSLTDLVAPTAVRKAYKRANLCVHPDKLQQRGASIQQKYTCEKVFDLLKEAWSKFNPDER